MQDERRFAAATERNRGVILSVLKRILPKSGTVLEIASGTGEHVTFFAREVPYLRWLPSEPQAMMRQSICAWADVMPSDNLRLPPLNLDVLQVPWPVETGDMMLEPIAAMVAINMVHISPWAATQRLLAGAGRILPAGGVLYLYGPYLQMEKPLAKSNEAFDAMLKSQNPAWGIRSLSAVSEEAKHHNLLLSEVVDMPANNLSVVFKKV